MGVEPYLLPSSLIASSAQRLVRTLCTKCRGGGLPSGKPSSEQAKIQPLAGHPIACWPRRRAVRKLQSTAATAAGRASSS